MNDPIIEYQDEFYGLADYLLAVHGTYLALDTEEDTLYLVPSSSGHVHPFGEPCAMPGCPVSVENMAPLRGYEAALREVAAAEPAICVDLKEMPEEHQQARVLVHQERMEPMSTVLSYPYPPQLAFAAMGREPCIYAFYENMVCFNADHRLLRELLDDDRLMKHQVLNLFAAALTFNDTLRARLPAVIQDRLELYHTRFEKYFWLTTWIFAVYKNIEVPNLTQGKR